jgi:hypothetical protein
MRADDPNLPILIVIVQALGDLKDEMVFVGGADVVHGRVGQQQARRAAANDAVAGGQDEHRQADLALPPAAQPHHAVGSRQPQIQHHRIKRGAG